MFFRLISRQLLRKKQSYHLKEVTKKVVSIFPHAWVSQKSQRRSLKYHDHFNRFCICENMQKFPRNCTSPGSVARCLTNLIRTRHIFMVYDITSRSRGLIKVQQLPEVDDYSVTSTFNRKSPSHVFTSRQNHDTFILFHYKNC